MLIHSKTDTLLRFAAVALLAAAVSGCSAEPDIEIVEPAPEGMVLRLSTGSSFSRADDEYDGKTDPYAEGEEAITRVSLFFFSEDPRLAGKAGEEPFYVHTVPGPLHAVTTADLTIKVPVDLIPSFVNKAAYVYALVNLSDISVDDAKKQIGGQPITYQKLQEVWTTEDGFAAKGVPGTFVMRGGAMVSLQQEGDKLAWVKGSVMLERLASKMRLWVQIPPAIYLDEQGKTIPYRYDENNRRESEDAYAERVKDIAAEKWEPVPTSGTDSNVRLYLYNIATRGRIDAYTGSTEERDDAGSDPGGILRYRDVDRRPGCEEAVRLLVDHPASLNVADISSDYPYTHATAYYSYPNVWNSLSPTEKHQTYVLLSMPWERTASKNETGVEYQVCYYKIPVNALVSGTDGAYADRLDPNRYYRIKIRLGMLGSKDLGDPLEIDASCEVADWTTSDVDVNIKPRRYLVVNQPVWTMNNTSSIEIPFSSSHDVEVSECYVTYFRYNDIWGSDPDSVHSDNPTDQQHKSGEFDAWLSAAESDAEGKNIKDSEGKISLDGLKWGETDQTLRQTLYYKKEYFYDKYYAEDADLKANGNGGFKYYVGHEHPKTFQEPYITRPEGLSGDEKERWDEYQTTYDMNSIYTYRVDNETQLLTFDHPLVWWKEAYSGGKFYYVPETKNERLRSEYSRCEITIKLRHIDRPEEEHLFEQTIHITQYPGLYIEVSHDYGNRVSGTGNNRKGNEYVLVNGNKLEAATPTNWDEASCYMPYFGFVNMNPNMYVIHTTQLEEDTDGLYILGDPRSLYYNNELGEDIWYTGDDDNSLKNTDNVENPHPSYWNFANYRILLVYPFIDWYWDRTNIASAPRLYNGGNGYPSYYYPADETEGSGLKKNFIAPTFRVASSFGKVQLRYSFAEDGLRTRYLDKESRREARRRCAAYQEAGRPAGRWRVPTIAEIEYVVQLSVDKKIPHLFGLETRANSYYWCSSGLVRVDLTNLTSTTYAKDRVEPLDAYFNIDEEPAVRCVYDEWYWTQVDGGEFPVVNRSTSERLTPTTKTFYWGDRPKDNPQTPDQP